MQPGFVVKYNLWHVQKELPLGQKKSFFWNKQIVFHYFPNFSDYIFFILYFDD